MDDTLEKPSASKSKVDEDVDNAEQSSDEDDGGPDWTRLPGLTSTSSLKPAIPKRGDKEFEPVGGVDGDGKGTGLQQYKLDRIRTAMFSALDVEKTVSSKAASYAIWYPEISRARIITARGNFLANMGHNTPLGSDSREQRKAEKAIELLPEEALYLMDRGSLFCWSHISDEVANEGVPMSVQQAYAEMIGKEELTLERYLVYAYLKRLGYTVTRARPPDPYYNIPPPIQSRVKQSNTAGILAQIANILAWPFKKLIGARFLKRNWWRPLHLGFAHRFLTYSSIFNSLRFIPSGYTQPLQSIRPPGQSSPYEVFFHMYKPTTSYRKTAPPAPDYSVVVVDAQRTPMPMLHELCSLFEVLPELPPPTPRKRAVQRQQGSSTVNKDAEPRNRTVAANTGRTPLYTRLRSLLRWLLRLFGDTGTKSNFTPTRRPNLFQMLKAGRKMIVVAAVDSGMISFFRFCQGSFDEWPMI